MNLSDNLGSGEAENVVVIFQKRGMTREQGSPIIVFLELELLDHRSHRSVQDENPLVESINDIKRSGFLEMAGHRESSGEPSIRGGRPQIID